MATPNNAYASNIQIALDTAGVAGSFVALGLQVKGTIGLKGEQIDVTQLNSAGYRMRVPGLLDGTGKLSALESYSDTSQTVIRNALTGRTRFWVKALLNDSSHAITMSVIPQKISLSTEPSKVVPVDFPFMLDGTPSNPIVFV